MPRPIYQLNTAHCTPPSEPGKSCGSGDCAVCQIVMAIDFATRGEVIVNQTQIRALSVVPDHGGLSLVDIKEAVLAFKPRFIKNGYEDTPRVSVHDNGLWTDFVSDARDANKWVIAFWNNEVWNQIVTDNDERELSGDLEFTGTHAVATRSLRYSDENTTGTSVVRVWNSLWDGRIDYPSGIRVIKGPRNIPLGWVKKSLLARTNTKNRVDWVTVSRAKKVAIPTEPDPCVRAIVPATVEGHAEEGAK